MDSVARPACCWRNVARHFARHSCAPLLLAPSPFRVPVPLLCSLGVPLGPTQLLGGLLPGRVGGGGGARRWLRSLPPGVSPRVGRCLHSPSGCNSVVRAVHLYPLRTNGPASYPGTSALPNTGSGTLWVAGESLRDRHVSCLPRWTPCPTRSPSQDTNRSTCRGECSWSGPLATPPGRCHLGPLANGPGRNPPYCSRSDGADTDTGGAPKPQRSGTSPALFAGSCHPAPPPVGPCLPAFIPRGAVPRPLLCPLAPAMSRLPLLPVPALACWCPWLFAFFFFFFFSFCPPHVLSLSPRRPRPCCGWA